MSSLRAYGPPTPPRSLQATPLAGIPGPRFPTYWPRAGWSRKSFWERKGRKTPPPIPDPDGRGRARGTERKRAPPGARRDPAPAATLRRGAPGIISDSPREPSGCSRSARTPGGQSPTAQSPSVPGGRRLRPRPGRPRTALTRRRLGVTTRARGEGGGQDAARPERRPLSASPGARPPRLRPLPRAAVVTPAPRPPPANPEAALGRPHAARARPPSATPAQRPAPPGPGEGAKFAAGEAGRAPRRPRALRASRARGLAAGAAGGRAPPRARDRLAGGRERICSGDTDEGFPGREEKREAKRSGEDKGWGRRGPGARSPEPRLFPRRGGGRRGRRGPCAEGAGPRPRSQRAPPRGLSGRPGLGPPTPALRPEGQRGRGTTEPLLRPRHPVSGPPDPLSRGELGLCVGAPGLAPAPPLRSQELPPLLAPGLETQNPESSLGFHPGSDTPKPGVLGENLARLPAAPHLCSVRAEEPWGPPALQALRVPSSLRPQPASHIAPAATALRLRRHRARAGHRPGLRKTLTRGFQAPSAGTRGWGHAGWKPGEGTRRGDPLVSSADPSRAFRGSGAQGELLGRRGGFLLHQAPPGVAGHHTEGT